MIFFSFESDTRNSTFFFFFYNVVPEPIAAWIAGKKREKKKKSLWKSVNSMKWHDPEQRLVFLQPLETLSVMVLWKYKLITL